MVKISIIVFLIAVFLTSLCTLIFGFKDKSVRNDMSYTKARLYLHRFFSVAAIILAVIISLLNPNFSRKAVVSNTKILKEVVQDTPLHVVTKLTMNPYLLAILNSHTINTLCIAKQDGSSSLDAIGAETISNDYIITTAVDAESMTIFQNLFQNRVYIKSDTNLDKQAALLCMSYILSLILYALLILIVLFMRKLFCQLLWCLYDKYHKEPIDYDEYM